MITLTAEQAQQIEKSLEALKDALICFAGVGEPPVAMVAGIALSTIRKALENSDKGTADAICAARAQEQAEKEPVAFHRASFLSGYEAAQSDANSCDVPPQGWLCTRQAGHDGPCAAIADDKGIELVNRAMARLADQEAAPVQQAEQEPVAILKPWSYGGSTGVNDYLMSDGSIRALTPDEARAINAAPQPVQQEPVAFKFVRYVDGKEMAEGVTIEREKTLDAAIKKAVALCPNRDKTVLVYAAPVRTKDLTDAEIAEHWYKLRHFNVEPYVCPCRNSR